MKIATLEDLLILKVQALYDIESEIIEALPKMIKAASDQDLKDGLSMHLEETKAQKDRLEEVFTALESKPKKAKSEAIRGLIEDAGWMLKQDIPINLMDASIIASARAVEHFEMACYMAATMYANALDRSDIEALLADNYAEEEAADDKLASVAETLAEGLEDDMAE